MKKVRVIVLTLMSILFLSLVFVFFTQREEDSDVIHIRLGHGQTESNERHLAAIRFKELVEERSNGKMEVEIFPNELLGSEGEMTESVSFGDLEIVAASATSQYGSLISIFELPYLFDSYEQAWEILDSEIGQEVADTYLKDNLRILAYFENGFRQITANKKIESPEDMAGLKIRTPEFKLSLQIFKALGANPTPMSFSELYTALQQGAVDAQENPVANIYANRFDEVQDYLIISKHQYMPIHFIVGDKFYQSLSKENQEIITKSAKEAAQYHRDLIKNNEQVMIEELKEKGMTVIEPDIEKFREKVAPVYAEFEKEHGSELLNKIFEKTSKKEGK